MAVHDLKSYRNACRVINDLLSPYIHQSFYDREKIIYLNEPGREMIASTKEVSKKGHVDHTLLRNDVYIHLNCPYDWQNESLIEATIKAKREPGVIALGLALAEKKKAKADAVFTRNGYMYIVEVDNERKMIENQRKIQTYKEIFPHLKDQAPYLMFFTKSEHRQRKLQDWMKGMRGEVKTFAEIR